MNSLREYVRIILERAKDPAEAHSEGLALYISKWTSSGSSTLVLYRPDALFGQLSSFPQGTDLDEIDFDLVHEGLIFGYMDCQFNIRCKALEVKFSAAQSGYGPLLYDAAMSISPNGFIMSDRLSVSDEAHKVWKFYKDNRADIQAVRLEKECENVAARNQPKQPKLDPDDALRYKFTGSIRSNFQQLVDNHEKAFDDIDAAWLINPRNLVMKLEEAGGAFFDDSYGVE